MLVAAAIYGTTFHSQDFKDVAGDIAVGRRTLPMVHPTLSRFAYLLIAVLWSLAIALMYDVSGVSFLIASIPVALACLTGMRFVFLSSVEADRLSFVLHGVRNFPKLMRQHY